MPNPRSSVKRSLQLYLQGHHAGARAALASVRSEASRARGSELGELLARLAEEIDEDRHTLQVAMARLGMRPSALRDLGARITASVGRRALRFQLPGAPQGRLIGLESLSLGIEGKLRLWCTLRALAPDDPRLGADPRLGEIDFDALIQRAERQRLALERHRVESARWADANIDITPEPAPTDELPVVENVGSVENVEATDHGDVSDNVGPVGNADDVDAIEDLEAAIRAEAAAEADPAPDAADGDGHHTPAHR